MVDNVNWAVGLLIVVIIVATVNRTKFYSEFQHRRHLRRIEESDQNHKDRMKARLNISNALNQVPDHTSPWHPMTDPVDIKHMGKLGEEANKLGSIACRIIIQGMGEVNPDTGVINLTNLENEMADVEANIELVKIRFGLNRKRIEERKQKKIARLSNWHKHA